MSIWVMSLASYLRPRHHSLRRLPRRNLRLIHPLRRSHLHDRLRQPGKRAGISVPGLFSVLSTHVIIVVVLVVVRMFVAILMFQ